MITLGSTLAVGQVTAPIHRPSDQGPSTILGRTGGNYTRFEQSAAGQGRTRFDYQNAQIGGSSGRTFGGGGRGGGMSAGAAANPFSRRTPPRSSSPMFSSNSSPFGAGDMFYASGMEEATSYNLPLLGWESPRIDSANSAVYIAPSDATVFHDFFGLTPTREAPPPPLIAESDVPQSELFGRINERGINDLIEKGKREFALGTTVGRPDRIEHVAKALDCFSAARRLDPKGWLPSLLSVNAALERNCEEIAHHTLEEAVTRNARAVAERPDMIALYGSREQFETTMRSIVQRATRAEPTSKLVLFEAYYSILAGDRSRAEVALRRAEEANRMIGNESTDRICRALRVALQ